MTTSDLNVSYHDLNSLNELRATAKTDQEQAIRQAARQFESVFMGMLLSSMRKANASFEDDNPMNSQTTGFYRDMYDSQLSTELSKSGSLGLADLMVQQLAPQYSKTDALKSLHKTQLHPDSSVHKLPVKDGGKVLPTPQHKIMKLDAEHLVYAKKAAAPTTPLQALGNEQLTTSSNVVSASVQQLGSEHVWAAKNSRPLAVASAGGADTTNVSNVPAALPAPDAAAAALRIDGSSSQQEFIRTVLPAAQQAAAVLGLEPVALIAQAALETGWGTKQLIDQQGKSGFNLFGIKAQTGWQGDSAQAETIEYRQGVAKKESATFRLYQNVEQSMQDYVRFIQQNPRYQAALTVTAEPAAYFRQLQAAGYATDPNYARKVVAVMQSPILQQLRTQLLSQGAQGVNNG